MQQRYGYPDTLRSTDNEIWGKLRTRFIRRIKHLQKHEKTLCNPYRGKSVCPDCEKEWPAENQFTHGRFCWTTVFRHRVRKHNEYVSPLFWLYVMLATSDLPCGKYERKVLRAYKGSEVERIATDHFNFFLGAAKQRKR